MDVDVSEDVSEGVSEDVKDSPMQEGEVSSLRDENPSVAVEEDGA
jgi:hypothetical protein